MLFAVSPETSFNGIAALRARSEVLEAKRAVQYFELPSRSLLNRSKPGMPFAWSLNPYRGCEFGCRYCYARYTHEFMELRASEDFEDKIYAKSGVAENLRREMRRFQVAESPSAPRPIRISRPNEDTGGRAPRWRSSRSTQVWRFPSPRNPIW